MSDSELNAVRTLTPPRRPCAHLDFDQPPLAGSSQMTRRQDKGLGQTRPRDPEWQLIIPHDVCGGVNPTERGTSTLLHRSRAGLEFGPTSPPAPCDLTLGALNLNPNPNRNLFARRAANAPQPRPVSCHCVGWCKAGDARNETASRLLGKVGSCRSPLPGTHLGGARDFQSGLDRALRGCNSADRPADTAWANLTPVVGLAHSDEAIVTLPSERHQRGALEE